MDELQPGAVTVWLADVAPASASAVAVLSGVERERLSSYRRSADRDRFVAGTTLARSLVARLLDIPPADVELDRTCPRCGRPHGKPRLSPAQLAATGGLELSISHAGALVGLAATLGHPVGLDVEPVAGQRNSASIASVALGPDEQARFAREPEPGRAALLMRYWTRKEAVLKALGTGLGGDPSLLEVTPPEQPPRVLAGASGVQLHDLGCPAGYLGSVAVLHASPLRVITLDGGPRP